MSKLILTGSRISVGILGLVFYFWADSIGKRTVVGALVIIIGLGGEFLSKKLASDNKDQVEK